MWRSRQCSRTYDSEHILILVTSKRYPSTDEGVWSSWIELRYLSSSKDQNYHGVERGERRRVLVRCVFFFWVCVQTMLSYQSRSKGTHCEMTARGGSFVYLESPRNYFVQPSFRQPQKRRFSFYVFLYTLYRDFQSWSLLMGYHHENLLSLMMVYPLPFSACAFSRPRLEDSTLPP